ncbi:MAG: hypothetical protein AAGC71_14580 [Pseudomonadota bacterium]
MNDDVSRVVRGGRDAFFEHADSDRLMAMLLRFMSEHWVLRERVQLLEQLLADKGVLEAGELESAVASEESDTALDQQSFAFIEAVIASAQNIERRRT